jgi:ABC-type antimicrobial peptide transport system permease subunit
VDATTMSLSGVDTTHPEIGALTASQITKGRMLRAGSAREAVLNVSYAGREDLAVGDAVKIAGKSFTVVGLAETPVGGQSADIYLKLGQLQQVAERAGRVNTVYVRATSASEVAAVANRVETTFDGASVTTAADLADRVSGSLVDAKNLTSKLGLVLEIVGLTAAVLIAGLLSLSSVSKRIRELGTLKAVGWSQGRVVRQVTGESLLQGALGAIVGVGLGIAAAYAVASLVPPLNATISAAADATPVPGPFGQGGVDNGTSTDVSLGLSLSPTTILLAALLALAGGLIAGAFGGLRAARLRPADALRHID